jgi:hypothetical protein
MLYNFVLLQDLVEDVQRPPAVNHEIFGDDFKPVDHWFAGENMLVVRGSKADPNSVIGEPVKTIPRHQSLQAT